MTHALPVDTARPVAGRRGRLLYICNVAWFFVSHRLPLARAAAEAGFDVHVAADFVDSREIRQIESVGATFHRVKLSRGGVNPILDSGLFLSLIRLCRRLRPDIVHNVTIKPMIYGTWASRMAHVHGIFNAVSGVGYVFTDGDGPRALLRTLARTAYRHAFADPRVRVIFQNPSDLEQFVSAGTIDRARTLLVPGSGVDIGRFSPAMPPSTPPVVILMPARPLLDKGVMEFAAASSRLHAMGLNVRCVLAGGLDPENPASMTSDELAHLERTTGMVWVGNVADMAPLFASSHIVCLPSYREGLPKALIEACASGRPIVTTDVPGCRDVVLDGDNGLLVPVREVDPLTDALSRLVKDEKERNRMGLRARQRAERVFDVRKIVKQTLDAYEEFA